MDEHVKTVLGFMNAAQTVLAIYGSPDGPTDPSACYELMTNLLEDPELLKAQSHLSNGVIFIPSELSGSSAVFGAAGQ